MDFLILNISEENSDGDIFEHIEEYGMDYFINIVKKLEENKIIIDTKNNDSLALNYFKSYLLLYLSNAGGWENPYKKIFAQPEFLPYLSKLISFLNLEDKKETINNFLENALVLDKDFDEKETKLKVLNEFSKNKEYLEIIIESHMKKLENINELEFDFNEHLFNQFFKEDKLLFNIHNHLLIKEFNDIKEYKLIDEIINNFLKHKETRDFVTNYLEELLYSFKNTFKIEPITYKRDTLYTNTLLKKEAYVLCINNILLEYFVNHKGVSNENMEKITSNYLFDDKSKCGFITKMFFILNKFMNLSINRLKKELENREIELDDYEDLLDEIRQDPYNPENLLNNVMVSKLHKYCVERIKEINVFTKLFSDNHISKLKEYTITWVSKLNSEPHEFLDQIIEQIIFEAIKVKNYNIHDTFLDLCYNVLKEKGITNNPHIKCEYLHIIVEYSRKLINESIYGNIVFVVDKLKDIFNILPELVIYIKKCSQDGELYDMTLSQYKIAYLINHMVFTFRDRCKVFFEKLENDEKFFKSIINLLIENFQHSLNEGLSNVLKISEYEKNPQDSEEYDRNLKYAKKNADFYLTCNFEFISLINNFTYYFSKLFICPEIKDSFAQNIIYFLEKLIGNNRKQYKIKNPEMINFKPISILEKLSDIILNMSKHEEFIKSVGSDERSYNEKLIERMLSVLNIHSKITHMKDMTLSNLNDKIIKLRKINKEIEDKEIPEELCDPIMSTLIEDPIMLPSTKIIMDKGVIARHLLSDPHDPFNRDELTMEKLEEFNEQDDIKKELDVLKVKIEKFKSE